MDSEARSKRAWGGGAKKERKKDVSPVLQLMPVIPILGRQRQDLTLKPG